MGKTNHQQNKNQKQSAGISSLKKSRGKYEKRLSPEQRADIIQELKSKIKSLAEIANDWKRNKETIRSIFKNQGKESLYSAVECYLIEKYLNQSNQPELQSKLETTKIIKTFIDNQHEDQQLLNLIAEVEVKRKQNSKSKRIIKFTSKNRRIIDKISKYLVLFFSTGETAVINNTAVKYILHTYRQVNGYENEDNISYQESTQQPLWNRRN